MELFYILKGSCIITGLNVMTSIKKKSHSTFLTVNTIKKKNLIFTSDIFY